MQLRLLRPKEARDAVVPLIENKIHAKSRYHGLALYYHGFASFQLKDDLAAGKSLSRLEPFTDPVFGGHARYLLARIYHNDPVNNQRQEAMQQYQGVIDDFAKQKQIAGEMLKQGDRFKNDPDEAEKEVEEGMEKAINRDAPVEELEAIIAKKKPKA